MTDEQLRESIRPVTAYVADCPAGCGWSSNQSISEDDALDSLSYHLVELNNHEQPGPADG